VSASLFNMQVIRAHDRRGDRELVRCRSPPTPPPPQPATPPRDISPQLKGDASPAPGALAPTVTGSPSQRKKKWNTTAAAMDEQRRDAPRVWTDGVCRRGPTAGLFVCGPRDRVGAAKAEGQTTACHGRVVEALHL